MPLFRHPAPLGLLVGLLLAACSPPTDVDRLAVSLRTIAFATQEQLAQWRSLPMIEGGETLVVRGEALVGCGRPEPHVLRRDDVVGVEIRAVNTNRICLGIVAAWVPVEATVSGLAPGAYRVRVGIAGLSERTEGTATIAAP